MEDSGIARVSDSGIARVLRDSINNDREFIVLEDSRVDVLVIAGKKLMF